MSKSSLKSSSDDVDHMISKAEAEAVEEDEEQPTPLKEKTQVTNGSGNTGGTGIAAMLKSSGPVVKCVLLKHMRSSGRDVHPHLDQSVVGQKLHQYQGLTKDDTTTTTKASAVTVESNEHPQQQEQEQQQQHREVLTELIEELEVDTTPGKNGVQKILGGNGFTFVGQYPDEGIVLMARADQFHDVDVVDTLSVLELKDFIKDSNLNIDLTTVVDKSELIQAVKDVQLPLNPHQLQPPFHDCPIRGDILLMRIADDDANEEEAEDDDDDDDDDADDVDDDRKTAASISKAIEEITTATSKPNDEFFLDYTKDEYIAFASRADIVASPDDDDDDGEYDDDDGENDDDDDEDEDIEAEDDEEDKHLLLNLILSEVIKSFREDNGRGPDSVELLDLRSRIAEQLNLSLPPPAPPVPDDERKRKTVDDRDDNPHHSTSPSPKKVKFTSDILEIEGTNTAIEEIYEHKTVVNTKEESDGR